MDIKWSEEQKKAIYTHDKNIIVSASAGAGKTMVLIGRLMHLICDLHYEIDDILAMTFSEAAAQEMKKRLSLNLQKEIAKNPDDAFLYQQLVKVNDANISTIHGFCLNIIKEYYYIINLDKKRIDNILDDNTCQVLKQQALKLVLKDYYHNEIFNELSMTFDQNGIHHAQLNQAIDQLAELANSQKNPLDFIDQLVQDYQNINELADLNHSTYQYFKMFFSLNTQLYYDLVVEYGEQEEKDVEQGLITLSQAISYLKNDDYNQYRDYFIAAIKQLKLVKSKAEEASDIETKILNNLYPQETFIDFHNQLVPLINLLGEITKKYIQTYNELKIANEGIDFSDMEHLAMEILEANNGYVANLYQERFKTIMVDEFQDTNDAQNELVNLISRGNNVFRVGDIKQSIYGFRYALPEIMQGLVQQPGPQDEVVFLSSNYRSGASIVNFNNQLYDTLMNLSGINCNYDEHDNVNCGSDKQQDYQFPIKMHLLDAKAIKEENPELSNDEIKSEYIVSLINEALAQGYKYQDIAILTRGNGAMNDIKEVLDQYGIPSFFIKKSGLFQSEGVQNIISTLKCLVNPYENSSFIAMFTSPLINGKYEELAQLKINNPAKAYYEMFADDNKLAPFIQLRKEVQELDVLTVFNTLLTWNNYYEEHLTPQERANLDYLYDKVAQVHQERNLSLASLVEVLNEWESLDSREAMSVGKNDDVVQIMTIHASKGLEYKVVIMYQKDNLVMKGGNQSAYYDPELGMGMDYYQNQVKYPTIEKIAYLQKNQQLFLEEELRLLYVATTRPEHQLHIVDLDKELSNDEYNLVNFYRAKGYSDWIRMALRFAPNTLFQQYHITSLPQSEKQAITADVNHLELKRYQYSNTSSEVVAPSHHSKEITSFDEFNPSGMLFGSLVHKMVELLPDTLWSDQQINTTAAKLPGVDERVIKQIKRLNDNDLFIKLRQNYQIVKELAYIKQEDSGVVSGYMDYVAYDDKEVIMVDFKTDASLDEHDLVDKYQGQMDAYHEALLLMYPNHQINIYLYSFKLNKMIKVW